jgi:hypothetical protein
VNFVLADGTMADADAHWLAGLEATGIGAGRTRFTPEQLAAARESERRVVEQLKAVLPTFSDASRSLGTRETLGDADRVPFALGTFVGQWGAPPVEAAYSQMVRDHEGLGLDGRNDYTITFVPPVVSQFWSITAYGARTMLMIANDLNRHSRGDRHLRPDADGTVTLRLGSDTRGKGDDAHFLPVPPEPFYLVLRMYGGDEAIQRGRFPLPVVRRLGTPSTS